MPVVRREFGDVSQGSLASWMELTRSVDSGRLGSGNRWAAGPYFVVDWALVVEPGVRRWALDTIACRAGGAQNFGLGAPLAGANRGVLAE